MKKASVSNSFFIEIIIAILFFSLCVAITLQLFVDAHLKSVLSAETNIAIVRLQNEAEEIKSSKSFSNIQRVYQQYQNQTENNEKLTYQIPLDDDWNITKGKAKYFIHIKLKNTLMSNGIMVQANIAAIKIDNNAKKALCDIDVNHYIAK
ncbi:hypothetical protein RBG61_10025 [Paludicola sp. MB14-C6]|uniref:hypothetical protein n=1 Tax=Paludihabitans sp. MB14-C6 TaxID=3070656 RepID=UPI0027DAC87C|nr:hypothetical protein [Paludicola sp. MB14-C6]WMJ22324.1 hypothetical protein RBG61_10025 [Paludicola sp. MB14-C6]